MKIRILIKDNLDKIYNILPLIQNNQFLGPNSKNVEFFNEKNWQEVFEKVKKEIFQKEFERVCVFDDDGMLPYLYFTKQIGFVTVCPTDVQRAKLSRAHNNANCIVMSCKYTKSSDFNNILNTFFEVEHDGGRHALRVKLMQDLFKESNVIHSFNENMKDTIVIASDHAGYNLKDSIKKYLIANGKKVIDVGCSSTNSTHYPLFAIASILNSQKAFCGIGICSTGVGISNTFNKFKGINSIVCSTPEQAQLARTKYNANVLILGANFIDFNSSKKVVDEFLKNSIKPSKMMSDMNKYGYEFDFNSFRKFELDPNIEIPQELKK